MKISEKDFCKEYRKLENIRTQAEVKMIKIGREYVKCFERVCQLAYNSFQNKVLEKGGIIAH